MPSAVVVSKRWVAGIALRKAGAPVLSSLPPIDGRNNDMVSCFPLQLRLELLQSVGFRDSEVEAYVIRPLTTFKLGQPQDLFNHIRTAFLLSTYHHDTHSEVRRTSSSRAVDIAGSWGIIGLTGLIVIKMSYISRRALSTLIPPKVRSPH